jgi:methylphosphotriester-DNA--protein-cysteine methyltransferase
MYYHSQLSNTALQEMLRLQLICYGANIRLKIYGRLDCASGKRIKRSNRVFFLSVEEAQRAGYRPCGHCMRDDYQRWICSTN